MKQSKIGMFGLAVMGQNLALNIARHGFPIAVFNRTTEKTDEFMAQSVRKEDPVHATRTVEEFVASLERPRRIVLLVKAGAPVDDTIAHLRPHLEEGDMIVDGGNSFWVDTERRAKDLVEHGLRFVGMGVSGGEEGALHGPSLMPGGPKEAYDALAPVLTKIAAQVEDGPCVTHVGPGGSGHFVKMVHNGIEYGDMQLIAECYDLMQVALGLEPHQMAEVFARWNEGQLESYLIEITARVLERDDPETGKPMVDVILDRAMQKGTGRWTSEAALELGVPAPTIHAAVEARQLSAMKDARIQAAKVLRGPSAPRETDSRLLDDIADGLYAAKICSYSQGMDLLQTVSTQHEWNVKLAEMARIWKGGCIIRARLLDRIQQAYRKNPRLPNLLLDEELGSFIVRKQDAWRRVIATAARHGVPFLAMSASLGYFDSYRRERLPQNLTQAQRDFFGAHTFERVDRPRGQFFHHEW